MTIFISSELLLEKKCLNLAIKLVFQNSVFSYCDSFFSPDFGCPMGNCLSFIICDIVMFNLESVILIQLTFKIILYTRYGHDILLLLFVQQINDIF